MSKKEGIPALVVEKSFAGLEVISDFVQRMCSQSRLGFKKTWEVMMAIDEICSSFVSCSYDDGDFIKIVWKDEKNCIKVLIEENGTPFNPLEDFDNEDIMYGIGPQLIKSMVDEVKYERGSNVNRIILVKKRRKTQNA